MYTAVSGCLKQLAQAVSTTFNHAFVYVIKSTKKKKATLRTVLSDQIFQSDVGLVFVVAHISSKCSWFNDKQLIQIMCKLQKVFQVCVNTHDSFPSEYISAECVLWTLDNRLK